MTLRLVDTIPLHAHAPPWRYKYAQNDNRWTRVLHVARKWDDIARGIRAAQDLETRGAKQSGTPTP